MATSDSYQLHLPSNTWEYAELEKALSGLDRDQLLNVFWALARNDLYFLIRYILKTKDYFNTGTFNEDWVIARCREVQNDSDRVLDVWARFHWKSNIKTFGNVIRKLLLNPNETICILSYTRPIAKQFLGQIQREIVENQLLKILSYNPISGLHGFPLDHRELKRNSLDDGIIINRTTNPKEPTLSAYGLVDSLPVGPHYSIRVYDDVVNKDSVNTPEMIKKTNQSYELSLPLGMPDDEAWYTGTYYAYDDTYHHMTSRGARLRLHPCYEIDEEGTQMGPGGEYLRLAYDFDKPVLYTKDYLKKLFVEMGAEEGSKTANMQMLCDPHAGLSMGFKFEWIKYYPSDPRDEASGKNIYILVDPANTNKRNSDYTAMFVVALGRDRNYYILDMVRDRMSLIERSNKLFDLHMMWQPIEVRYEQYGLQADISHIEYLQNRRSYRFNVVPVRGNVRKEDRIERLVPLFKAGRVYLPMECIYINTEGNRVNLVDAFINEEYLAFPHSSYKDMLDAFSRIAEPDLRLEWPRAIASNKRYNPDKTIQGSISWMGY